MCENTCAEPAALPPSNASSATKETFQSPNCGKIIVRTDIENISNSINQISTSTTHMNSTREDSSGAKSGLPTNKTASISVVPSEELLESRVLRDGGTTNSPNTTLNKLSIVPEQQLLESSHTNSVASLAMQNIVYRDDVIQQTDNVNKLPLRLANVHEAHGEFRRSTDMQVDLSASYLRSADLCALPIDFREDGNLPHIGDSPDVPEEEEEDQSDVEVVPSDGEFSHVNNECGLEVAGGNISERELACGDNIYQPDAEEDLQVILTSSHQHHLYQPYSPRMKLMYNVSSSQCDDATPVKDTAKAQWESLQQIEKSGGGALPVDQPPEAKEIKVKSLANHSPSHSGSRDATTIEVISSPSTVQMECEEEEEEPQILLHHSPMALMEECDLERSSRNNSPFSVIAINETSLLSNINSLDKCTDSATQNTVPAIDKTSQDIVDLRRSNSCPSVASELPSAVDVGCETLARTSFCNVLKSGNPSNFNNSSVESSAISNSLQDKEGSFEGTSQLSNEQSGTAVAKDTTSCSEIVAAQSSSASEEIGNAESEMMSENIIEDPSNTSVNPLKNVKLTKKSPGDDMDIEVTNTVSKREFNNNEENAKHSKLGASVEKPNNEFNIKCKCKLMNYFLYNYKLLEKYKSLIVLGINSYI